MKVISGINPRFKHHFAIILNKVVVGKRSAAQPRTANCSIFNIFAKTDQILDSGIKPLFSILICNSDKVVIFKGELKSEAFFFPKRFALFFSSFAEFSRTVFLQFRQSFVIDVTRSKS